ncbi:hypothetical protein [Bacteroides sp. 519]|uniref:hypothetical protein n=1 Tax=Bacteroides sp. 519 TaxID=2302937 RepID=UPI0013D52D40|nr:hypothetical protein [Bacteroides sp. 519]NDV57806.1 hypothetical protein [Bacteroides sp. 519]
MRNTLLKQIANTLYINVQQVSQNDLFTGKMGIALFFYEYVRSGGSFHYHEAADRLIEMIWENLPQTENELYEIVQGINYLISNKYIDADPDILEEIYESIPYPIEEIPIKHFSLDREVSMKELEEYVNHKIQHLIYSKDLSLDNGLAGLGMALICNKSIPH